MEKKGSQGHQEVIGVPTVTATGETNFTIQENTLTYFPSDVTGPIFLGATKGHNPILIHCGNCGYRGESKIKDQKGVANIMGALLLFGIGYFLPVDDTHHYCPRCNAHLAYSKYF